MESEEGRMLILDRLTVEKVTEPLGEVSGMREPPAGPPHLLVAAFPGESLSPYPAIRVVISLLGTHLDFKEMYSVDRITGPPQGPC